MVYIQIKIAVAFQWSNVREWILKNTLRWKNWPQLQNNGDSTVNWGGRQTVCFPPLSSVLSQLFCSWGQAESFLQQLCSVSLTDDIHRELIFMAALDIILSVTALFGNTLILVALRKESLLHPQYRVLFRCLATTDLCVGIIAEPLKVCYFMDLARKKWNLCRYALRTFSLTGYTLFTYVQEWTQVLFN